MAHFWAIFRKDLLVEGRARDLIPAMAVLVLLLLAVTGAAGLGAQSAPAMLWIAVALSSASVLARSFHQETDQDQWHALRLAAVDPGAVYLGKAAANFTIVLAVEILALLAVAVFFDVSFTGRWPALAAVLLLGTAGIVAIGTLLGAMLAAARMREALLPVLLLPLAAPAVTTAAGATARIFGPSQTGSLAGEMQLLLAFSLLFVAVSMLIFDSIMEE